MKKTASVLVSLLLCMGLLAGCGSGESKPQTTAAPAESAAAPQVPEGAVEVDNVDDLITAIAPDAHIFLAPGIYDLSKAESYGSGTDAHIGWSECYDGYQLVIKNVPNLTIEAAQAEKTVICTMPRYANVMTFNDCENLSLKNITVGHVEGAGYCSGGVLFLSGCKNSSVDGCALFGCGTIGVQAEYSEALTVKNTEIYDCSYGAAEIIGCYDVLFDGCNIFDCSVVGPGLLAVENSAEVAFINSSIYNNNGSAMLACSFSGGVYFGGNTVKANRFEGMFFCAEYPATVEKCSLEKENAKWFYDSSWYGTENVMVVSADNELLAGSALAAMQLSEAGWTARAKTEYMPQGSADTDEEGFIHVSSVDELLSAIAPGASICLESGVYKLSDAVGYGSFGGEYYRWQECYDGAELVIFGVDGLTIKGELADRTAITAEPRYANVISFESCSGITLVGFTAGHTEAPGYCTGGVIRLTDCRDAKIETCALYGCGTLGVDADNCEGLEITGCDIYECSYGGMNLFACRNISITSCNIYNCGGDAVFLGNCGSVDISSCNIHDNTGSAVTVSASDNISYNGTKLECSAVID